MVEAKWEASRRICERLPAYGHGESAGEGCNNDCVRDGLQVCISLFDSCPQRTDDSDGVKTRSLARKCAFRRLEWLWPKSDLR